MDGSMMEQIGAWLGEHLRPDEAIAATPIGAVAYFSRRPVIDMLGLVDREIARHPDPIAGLTDTWKEKKYNAASVLRRRPGAILFSTGMRPSAAGEKALFLYEDFHASYYALYFRPDRRMLQPCTIFRLRPDAPAPPDTLRPVADAAFLDDYCEGLIAFWRERRPTEAARRFEQSVRVAPPFFVGGLEWWCTTLYDLGDPRAVPLLEEVLRLNPYAFRASTRLGHYHVRRGELDVAEGIYRAQLERNPEDAQAWEGLAEISRRRGRLADGFEQIRKSLSYWSTNESAVGIHQSLEEMVMSAPGMPRNPSP
jgi:tetratricopeptide (TPR) repeat protein